jgi:ABC-type uncharacterized transport system substrate-binding protein
MSYGGYSDALHQVGIYTGRILKGEKPADLPVVQPTKFELVINLKTAKALGLNVGHCRRGHSMKRRTFVVGLGSAAAWPVAARAQQTAMPVIGLLSAQSADDDYKNMTVPFLQGLKEGVTIAASVDIQCCRVRRSPSYPATQSIIRELQSAARTLGLQLIVVSATTDSDLETAFANFSQQRVGAVLVCTSNFYNRRTEQLAALAAHHAMPAMFQFREYALAGGLMSYGSRIGYSFHQAGIYTGRILKGEKPADLPVEQATKIEFTINLKAAKALGLTIPETLLATADEVIQ